MSLWSRNRLRIVLAPERVALLHTGHRLTLRGYAHTVRANGSVPCQCADGDARPWDSAVRTLAAALPTFVERKQRARVEVILSNHFVQYLLVPWLDKISDEEEVAYAQHCFRERYGEIADTWTVRTSPGRAGTATLASAVDSALLEELRAALAQAGLSVHSIQPHLMTACNSCLASLQDTNAWVALLEPGNVCLGVLQQGQLAWIRKLRIGADWDEALPALLERERLLADAGAEMDEVLLWAPHLEDTDIRSSGRWKIRHLKPGMSGIAAEA